MGRGKQVLAFVSAIALTIGIATLPAGAVGPVPLTFNLTGTNGVGGPASAGAGCSGTADGFTTTYTGTLPAGTFTSTLPANVTFVLNLLAVPPYTRAITPGSPVTLSNGRGSLQLTLASGVCGQPTPPLLFDGTNVSGAGTWTIGQVTGAYRQATGSGTFSVNAQTANVSNNPFNLKINGVVDVLDPALSVTGATGRFDGLYALSYLKRLVTVDYTVRNTGAGDAFGVQLLGASPLSSGVTALTSTPLVIGDLAAGASRKFSVLYRMAPTGSPCRTALVNCIFKSQLTFSVPDALDAPLSPNPAIAVSSIVLARP